MKRLLPWVIPILLSLALVGCGPPRPSMFPPTVSVQELYVEPDGHWRMQVRILNNSYGSMKFRRLKLTMKIRKEPAAHIDKSVDLDVPALSPGITQITVAPSAQAAAALAAIADKGSAGNLPYALVGTATAIPEHGHKPHDYRVHSHDWLSAVPGITHTFR